MSSPNQQIHDRFCEEIGLAPGDEDPSNKLLDLETQLQWLREIGFEHVDCHWKWRELTLLVGRRPDSHAAQVDLAIDDAPTLAEVRWLDDQLGAFNQERVGRDDFKPLNLVLREHGSVIAGLKAVTGWEWLYVQILWVHERHRRTGFGSRLLEQAERDAFNLGCTGACLSSFNFQAPEFYLRRGYSTFGQIDDYPPGGTMFFMSKRFEDVGQPTQLSASARTTKHTNDSKS